MYQPKEVLLDDEQLEERLRYWQKRLRLQDWRIEAVIVRGREIEYNDALADYTIPIRQAYIKVADATDWAPMLPQPLDMEWNLVHELLHVVWALPTSSIDRGTEERLERWHMEQSIEATTHALISLERELRTREADVEALETMNGNLAAGLK
jgi:hypothetical protein